MRMTPIVVLLGACTPEPVDCLTLGGGYGGVDIGAIEAECRADPRGECCEADDYIEIDAATCLFDQWGAEIDSEPVLGYTYGWRTVAWFGSRSNHVFIVGACDGEFIGEVIEESF